MFALQIPSCQFELLWTMEKLLSIFHCAYSFKKTLFPMSLPWLLNAYIAYIIHLSEGAKLTKLLSQQQKNSSSKLAHRNLRFMRWLLFEPM